MTETLSDKIYTWDEGYLDRGEFFKKEDITEFIQKLRDDLTDDKFLQVENDDFPGFGDYAQYIINKHAGSKFTEKQQEQKENEI
jgi:hypothetical protein